MALPTGTVTFLFTDIEGSTMLAQQYPKELPTLLERHHAILRQAIESHTGYVFQIIGDAFCAAFHTAMDALDAALTAQRALQREAWSPAPIKVRMGINTGIAQAGAADTVAGGYTGYSTLTRVQRVMSAAHGGQILLSHTTAELVHTELSGGISLRDMGEHKLKGLLHSEKLWQVIAPDLIQDFAPLQTLDATPNNLPSTLNRFVGRTRKLEEVKQRLSQTRLLTLLGPGGTGKTRLALQAASRPADGLPLINEALQIGMAGSSQTFAPEVLRVKGVLLLALDPNNTAEAESLFQLAVNISQQLNIPMYELRAALRLSRLWQAQGKTEQARTLLSGAYAKMTEGFALTDLMQAQALLKELM